MIRLLVSINLLNHETFSETNFVDRNDSFQIIRYGRKPYVLYKIIRINQWTALQVEIDGVHVFSDMSIKQVAFF